MKPHFLHRIDNNDLGIVAVVWDDETPPSEETVNEMLRLVGRIEQSYQTELAVKILLPGLHFQQLIKRDKIRKITP